MMANIRGIQIAHPYSVKLRYIEFLTPAGCDFQIVERYRVDDHALAY
jgi:hypothetical protein